MKEVMVPVSIGELVDKVTILRIKSRKITDQAKLQNIRKELDALTKVCQSIGVDLQGALTLDLEAINEKLWVIEDDIRDKERDKVFDQEFIRLARAVYVTNDQRFVAKGRLNEAYGSAFKEEKSYQKYD